MKKIDRKTSLIILLVAIAVILIVFLMFSGSHTTYDIEDKCGRFINLFSHTIDDENTCHVRCSQQCEAKGSAYGNIEFVKKEGECNTCTCTCTKRWW